MVVALVYDQLKRKNSREKIKEKSKIKEEKRRRGELRFWVCEDKNKEEHICVF